MAPYDFKLPGSATGFSTTWHMALQSPFLHSVQLVFALPSTVLNSCLKLMNMTLLSLLLDNSNDPIGMLGGLNEAMHVECLGGPGTQHS